ncbi:MAG: hypothetical protein AAF502_14180 [Bacteroidota bacterium]
MSIARKSKYHCPDLIRQLVRRERNRNYVLAIVFTVLSGYALMIAGRFDTFVAIVLVVLAMVFIISAFKLFYEASKASPVENAEIIQTISNSPMSIVWVYSVVTENMPFGVSLFSMATLYLKLNNGDQITLSIPPSAAKSASSSLNGVLKHATFGYTKEREQWYVVEPKLLLQSEE